MTLDFSQVKAEPLAKYHNLESFDCNDKDINDFIKNDALTYQDLSLAITTIFIHNQEIIGFFSAAADSLKLKSVEKEYHKIGNVKISEIPSIKIARLGRDIRFKGLGVGNSILKWAIGYILDCSQMMAVRFVTVDSYPDKVGWYKEFGFVPNLDERYAKKDNHVSMRYDLFNGIPK